MRQILSIKKNEENISHKTNLNSYYLNNLEISTSLETFIFSDLQEILSLGNILAQHLEILNTLPGISYKGINKFEYTNIIKILQTIIDSKKRNLRYNKQKYAIAFLHQELKLSPNLIRNILRLFNVKLEVSKILEISYKVFVEKPKPKWLQNIGEAYIGGKK